MGAKLGGYTSLLGNFIAARKSSTAQHQALASWRRKPLMIRLYGKRRARGQLQVYSPIRPRALRAVFPRAFVPVAAIILGNTRSGEALRQLLIALLIPHCRKTPTSKI